MVTSILEFFFSNHYLYDSNNRFNLRIKNAIILNKLENMELADKRLKKALFYYGLEMLDKTSIALQPIGFVFGNIYFKEKGRLIPAEIQVDNERKGNVYVAIIKDQTVVTLKLLPLSISNEEIVADVQKHDATELKALYDMDNKVLNLNDKKRKTITIDLDMSDSEFLSVYPAPVLKNNQYQLNGSGVSNADMEWINKDKQASTDIKNIKTSYQVIPENLKQFVPEKEFVLSEGQTIWVPYPDGPKQKKIKKIIRDEKGTTHKYFLEFEATLKPFELNKGTMFIISPELKTENFRKLYTAFDLEFGTPLNFQGPIERLSYYSKEKTKSVHKLGVIINPRNFF